MSRLAFRHCRAASEWRDAGVAKALVEARPMPAKAADDVLHVATATVYGCEYLLTWNCRHIANAEIRRAAGRIGADTGMNYR